MFSSIILSLAFVLVAVALIDAHGTVLDPAARQSLWRSDKRAKANYNDNQQFCGGFGVSAIGNFINELYIIHLQLDATQCEWR